MEHLEKWIYLKGDFSAGVGWRIIEASEMDDFGMQTFLVKAHPVEHEKSKYTIKKIKLHKSNFIITEEEKNIN
jgi:hypothetical protein